MRTIVTYHKDVGHKVGEVNQQQTIQFSGDQFMLYVTKGNCPFAIVLFLRVVSAGEYRTLHGGSVSFINIEQCEACEANQFLIFRKSPEKFVKYFC